MDYIGFVLLMIGLAATGAAIDGRGDIVVAVAMMIGGAWLMWLFREEDEDGEEEDDGAACCGGTAVDKPAGESGGGCATDPQRGGGGDIPDPDDGILPRKHYGNGPKAEAGYLCGTERVDR